MSLVVAQQQFKDEPQYTEVNPGADATLTCVVENIGGDCRWQKDGKPVGIYEGKYQWSSTPNLGDCSLDVLEVNITYDDGLWECQVTSSSFASQDALASQPARLVVREPPRSFAIVQNEDSIQPGGQITLVDGQVESLRCESRHSNPPPKLKWYLGDRELQAAIQTNETEEDDQRRWKSISTLQHKFAKTDFGKPLMCKIEHPAYRTGSQETTVVLDVLYKPIVSVSRTTDEMLEEGRSSVTLECQADANPPARIFWKKMGPAEQRQYTERLEFNPVMRKDSGSYICQAENSLGLSNEEPAEIDVLYPPKILRVTPMGGSTVGVHNRTILSCSAEGNPAPKYQWLQKLPTQQVLKRGYEERLILEDTTYDHQGDYVCEAINMIGGQKKIVQSEPVHIEVRGAPQVLRYSVAKEVEAISGRDVRLEMDVCSDPVPSRTTWDWGTHRVDAGQDLHGRYLAEQMVEHPEREDCYVARLLVRKVSPSDSKRYFLDVENIHGTDRYAIGLIVKDPVSMASVIGVVIALLVLFVLMVIVLLYAYKRQKMCFKDGSKLDKEMQSGEHHNGYEAEKTMNGRGNGYTNGNGVNNSSLSGPLPPDGMYHVSDMTHGSLMDPNGSLADKLWPENPAYQVYIPGYQQHHSIMNPQPNYSLGPGSLRARSTTPTGGMMDHPGGIMGKDNRMLYAELQFPVTSNYGSMKKKGHRFSASSTNNTNSTTVLNSSTGEPSPTSEIDNNSTLPISQSMDNMHRYLPDYLTISNRKTAV
eukprot:TCALIF_13024-PA protein Name:"Similar to KIRREL Kin of IRRE-like protein 1 (Homo sapiens)" AED:0.12 eAED:0.13 QI:0/0.83/0.76/0.92/0.91/1/13/506/759